MNHYYRCLGSIALIFAAGAPLAALSPVKLRCQYEENPLGLHAVQPRLSWILESGDPSQRGLRQTAYQILVASSEENLAKEQADAWDTGKVESSHTFQIPYAGKALASGAVYFWKVRVWDAGGTASAWSAPARWNMGLLHPVDWRAKWIAGPTAEAMPIFRRAFRLDKLVRRAVLYISGLGQYEARLNGARLGDGLLQPGWTHYRKTVFYNAFDVTDMLRSGDNALAVMLGNGIYHVVKTPGRYTKLTGSFGQPKVIAQLSVSFNDGSSFELVSDKLWKAQSGPIVYSHAYGGEDFDARCEPDGWDRPGFQDDGWSSAVEVAGPGGILTAQTSPDIKVIEVHKPVKITEPRPGIRVYDLGQNLSGWPKITVRGPAGATLKLIGAELLDKDGLIWQQSAGGSERSGMQWYSYTLKGSGDETWRPRFSYWGFRYVQVEGAANVELLSLESQFIHSSAPIVGEFSCSKPLFNQIHTLINAAIRSNMQSVLTDCPHREKLGWLEESHLLGSAIMYNYDVQRLYGKIADDIRDSQNADGLVPDIAPEYVVFENGFRDSPEWGSAAVLNPWLVYRHYGDRRLLEEQYDVAKRYVDYLASKANGHILSHGLGDWYDIGPKGPGVSQLTSLGLTATAIYYADLVALRETAALLNRADDATRFAALADEARDAFNAKLYDPKTGVYDRGSQTAFAMPLVIGLVAEENRKSVLDMLVANIRQNGNRVTAGDIGFHYVVQALSEGGRSDVMYDMLSRTDGPSYGYQLKQGATTLTEAWDANPTSSQNHFMLGHAEEWFYRGLAGLDLDFTRAPSERIRIRPAAVGDITEAKATHRSVVGEIASAWRIDGGTIIVQATVPPNMTATVYVPTSSLESVTESGRAATTSEGVRFMGAGDGTAIYEVDSGVYRFSARQ